VRSDLFSIVDLAPTFTQIAGAQPGRTLDGRSMLASLRRGDGGYQDYLIQAGLQESPWWWRGVYSRQFMYARYNDGFEELYDMARDPHQLTNVAADPAYNTVRSTYSARLDALADCAGASCLS
jgi:arylsulfatase A-like enzyme